MQKAAIAIATAILALGAFAAGGLVRGAAARAGMMSLNSQWNDPDTFRDTTLWIDARPELRQYPFILPFHINVIRTNDVWIDWGDGSRTGFLPYGDNNLYHVYDAAGKWYKKLVIHSSTDGAYKIGGQQYGSFFAHSISEARSLGFLNNLVVRARIGSGWNLNGAYGILDYVSNCDTFKMSSNLIASDSYRCLYISDWGILKTSSQFLFIETGVGVNISGKIKFIDYTSTDSNKGLYQAGAYSFNSLVFARYSMNTYNHIFSNNQKLKTLILTEAVTNITESSWGYSFERCQSLSHLMIRRSDSVVPYGNGIGKIYTYGDLKIHVPAALVDSYKSTAPWSSWPSRIVGYQDADSEESRLAELVGAGRPWTCQMEPEL